MRNPIDKIARHIGITRMALAAQIKRSPALLCDIVRGRSGMSFETAMALSKASGGLYSTEALMLYGRRQRRKANRRKAA